MTKKFFSIIIFCTLLSVLTTYSQATRVASAIGTVEYAGISGSTITTTDMTGEATIYYRNAGYNTVRNLADPSYTLFLSNIISEVVFLASHGSIDSVTFKSGVGIKTDNSSVIGNIEYVGINNLSQTWEENTLLVTYIACETAGENGEYSENSLTYKTVADGNVKASLGFTDTIDRRKCATLG